MAEYRFRQIRSAFTYAFYDKTDVGPWARIRQVFDGFNKNRLENIASSTKKILDESMSSFVPWTTKTGGLPNISFIQRKPEPLGTEFKASIVYFNVYSELLLLRLILFLRTIIQVVCCATTGCMLHIEVQEGKHAMN